MVSKWSWGGQTIWCVVVGLVLEVTALSGPNVCMVQQKYNITKRVKYRAPMSVRTYEWCFAMPPRCSKWSTEMRELTRLETGERIAEVAVCCPGYKMRDVTCVPICPSGKMGNNCSEDCPADKWGPNCAKDCGECNNGYCDSITGECECDEGWQGESCQVRMPTTSPPALMEKLLTTTKSTVQTLATSVPTTLTTISTSIMQILSTSKPSLSSSIVVTSSTEKTENTPKTSTSQTTITSVVNPTLSYENVTPSTTLWVDNKEKFLKTTVTNFIYNRTETSEAVTIPSSTTTALKTSSTTTINVTEPSTIEHITTAPSTITSVTPTVSSTVKRNSTTTEPKINTVLTVEKEIRAEPTPKIETTTKNQSTSVKFKPKEIWIKPSQKEPEHITAVMSDRERDHTSLDLISVISIAGGVMMAVITVAVVIVMIERCKRHRYDDVRKINDIRMQVIMDNNDEPPPYVRSIFHTPLPEPPTTDRNHYQPISTLDRNLKQFMRPVVVQAISPVMLENFRGILECHYDHLPHTNQDFGTIPVRCSVASSMKYDEKLLRQRPLSVADYTIDSLKCEAKLDVIDCTTSEPLYAEIPCWRPPSEHAIEVVNLNGEAVTEL
ncbi:nimrod A [Danaus plexippus plexippus]|uniref:Nimrod A n=1 Tax=Danaus plexippus plexippus TaxID=278856 RepID=A0A212EUY5_DANPL|nr:nimrod A [Danaus plexippus plexippus]